MSLSAGQNSMTLDELYSELKERGIDLKQRLRSWKTEEMIQKHPADIPELTRAETETYKRNEAISYLIASDSGLYSGEDASVSHGYRWHIIKRHYLDRLNDALVPNLGTRLDDLSMGDEHVVGETIQRTREECERFLREAGEFYFARWYHNHPVWGHQSGKTRADEPSDDTIYVWEYREPVPVDVPEGRWPLTIDSHYFSFVNIERV